MAITALTLIFTLILSASIPSPVFAAAKSKSKTPAATLGGLSLTPTIGGYLFAGSEQREATQTYGLRIGYDNIAKSVTDSLGIEGTLNYLSSTSKKDGSEVSGYLLRLDAIYPFILGGKWMPFLVVGGGGMVIDTVSYVQKDPLFNYGAGLKYFLEDYLALRVDARHLLVYNNISLRSNFEVGIGVSYYFGKERKKKPVPPPASEQKEKKKPNGSDANSVPAIPRLDEVARAEVEKFEGGKKKPAQKGESPAKPSSSPEPSIAVAPEATRQPPAAEASRGRTEENTVVPEGGPARIETAPKPVLPIKGTTAAEGSEVTARSATADKSETVTTAGTMAVLPASPPAFKDPERISSPAGTTRQAVEAQERTPGTATPAATKPEEKEDPKSAEKTNGSTTKGTPAIPLRRETTLPAEAIIEWERKPALKGKTPAVPAVPAVPPPAPAIVSSPMAAAEPDAAPVVPSETTEENTAEKPDLMEGSPTKVDAAPQTVRPIEETPAEEGHGAQGHSAAPAAHRPDVKASPGDNHEAMIVEPKAVTPLSRPVPVAPEKTPAPAGTTPPTLKDEERAPEAVLAPAANPTTAGEKSDGEKKSAQKGEQPAAQQSPLLLVPAIALAPLLALESAAELLIHTLTPTESAEEKPMLKKGDPAKVEAVPGPVPPVKETTGQSATAIAPGGPKAKTDESETANTVESKGIAPVSPPASTAPEKNPATALRPPATVKDEERTPEAALEQAINPTTVAEKPDDGQKPALKAELPALQPSPAVVPSIAPVQLQAQEPVANPYVPAEAPNQGAVVTAPGPDVKARPEASHEAIIVESKAVIPAIPPAPVAPESTSSTAVTVPATVKVEERTPEAATAPAANPTPVGEKPDDMQKPELKDEPPVVATSPSIKPSTVPVPAREPVADPLLPVESATEGTGDKTAVQEVSPEVEAAPVPVLPIQGATAAETPETTSQSAPPPPMPGVKQKADEGEAATKPVILVLLPAPAAPGITPAPVAPPPAEEQRPEPVSLPAAGPEAKTATPEGKQTTGIASGTVPAIPALKGIAPPPEGAADGEQRPVLKGEPPAAPPSLPVVPVIAPAPPAPLEPATKSLLQAEESSGRATEKAVVVEASTARIDAVPVPVPPIQGATAAEALVVPNQSIGAAVLTPAVRPMSEASHEAIIVESKDVIPAIPPAPVIPEKTPAPAETTSPTSKVEEGKPEAAMALAANPTPVGEKPDDGQQPALNDETPAAATSPYIKPSTVPVPAQEPAPKPIIQAGAATEGTGEKFVAREVDLAKVDSPPGPVLPIKGIPAAEALEAPSQSATAAVKAKSEESEAAYVVEPKALTPVLLPAPAAPGITPAPAAPPPAEGQRPEPLPLPAAGPEVKTATPDGKQTTGIAAGSVPATLKEIAPTPEDAADGEKKPVLKGEPPSVPPSPPVVPVIAPSPPPPLEPVATSLLQAEEPSGRATEKAVVVEASPAKIDAVPVPVLPIQGATADEALAVPSQSATAAVKVRPEVIHETKIVESKAVPLATLPAPVAPEVPPAPAETIPPALETGDRSPAPAPPLPVTATETQPAPTSTELPVRQAVRKKIVRKLTVEFDINSSYVKPAFIKKLRKLADIMKSSADASARIEGHADSTGRFNYNVGLSKRRAESVRRSLIRLDVDPGRISTVGYGPSRPIADNATIEGRQKNRRAVTMVTLIVYE